MGSWSAKKKLFVTIFTGTLVLFCTVYFAVRPLALDLADIHKNTQEQKFLLSDLILEEASFKTARANLEKIKDRIEEIDALFPVREELVGHIQRLEQIAAEYRSDFSMTITDPADDTKTPKTSSKNKEPEYEVVPGLKKVEVLPYDFHLEGTFTGIIYFLKTLENQPFYSEIDSMVFRSQVSNRGSGTGAATLASRTGKVLADVRSAFYAKK